MSIQGDFTAHRVWEKILPELVPQRELEPLALEAELQSKQPVKAANTSGSSENSALREQNHQVHASTLSISNLHNHGELFISFLRARREVFICQKGWDLPEVDGMEFDQYDTPRARWLVLHEFGEVLGGVRLTPTTSQCGCYSYMVRDAQLGLIDSIPRDVLFFKAPVAPTIWEATRLFLSPNIPSTRRASLQRLLLDEMAEAAALLGADHVIGIVPAVFSKWMTRLGLLSALQVGPIMNIDGERSQAALMRVRSPSGSIAEK
jgi:N-acyl-L-homoserine lactone synthetase